MQAFKTLLLLLVSATANAEANLTTDFPPWGDTLFGVMSGIDPSVSGYYGSGVSHVRHVGWSWTPDSFKMPPLCHTRYAADGSAALHYSCSVSAACTQVGGIPLGDQYCMEAPNAADDDSTPSSIMTVVGPTCWNRMCTDIDTARSSCGAGGGIIDPGAAYSYIFPAEPDNIPSDSWCYYPSERTVLGPACYGNTCYDIESECVSLGGSIFADLYCILDPKYTVMGPICLPLQDEEKCFHNETATLCSEMGGTTMANDLFCVVEGEFSALGPFCFQQIVTGAQTIPTNGTKYRACTDGTSACNTLGGTSFGEGLFCMLPEDDYHVISFCAPGGGCSVIGDGDPFSTCERDFGGTNLGLVGCLVQGSYTVGSALAWGDVSFPPHYESTPELVYHHGMCGSSFVLNGSYSLYGPTCYGSQCYTNNDDCNDAGGKTVGGIFCAIPTSVSLLPTIAPTSTSDSQNYLSTIPHILALIFIATVVTSL